MAFLASVPLLGRLLGGGADAAAPAVRVSAVPVHAIENNDEKRPRTLKHLLRANHVHHALLAGSGIDGGAGPGHDPALQPNSLAYALTAAYLLGAGTEHLHALYEALSPALVPWTPSPAEVTAGDWRDFWGDARYQRAYIDFFEDVLAEHAVAYDWKRVVATYLWEEAARDGGDDGNGDGDGDGRRPLLLLGLGGGAARGAPLLHLACAYEMDSRVLAMEALALAAVSCGKLPRDLDERPEGGTTTTTATATATAAAAAAATPASGARPAALRDLLARVAADARLDAVAAAPAATTAAYQANPETLLDDPATEAVLLEYYHAWPVDAEATATTTTTKTAAAATDLTPCLQDAQTTAAALLVATTAAAGAPHRYSALLGRVLAASHAVRVLLPHVPRRFHAALLRQWWLLALAAYVAAGRPAVDGGVLPAAAAGLGQGKGWAYAETQALGGRWQTDADYVMAIRALKAAADTWGDADEHFLAAAVRFVDDFDGWTA